MGSRIHTHLLVGSYAVADQESIFQYAFNAADGTLSLLDSVCGIENPSFIVPDRNGRFLFAISETKKRQLFGYGHFPDVSWNKTCPDQRGNV
jgi:6-phosphogluconolactonase